MARCGISGKPLFGKGAMPNGILQLKPPWSDRINKYLLTSWWLLLALLYLLPGEAAEGKVAVVYPQLREPYNKVFDRILEGIIEELDDRVVPYRIPPTSASDSPGLNELIRKNDISAVIGLGRQGYEATGNLPLPVVRVAGGLVTTPDNVKDGIAVITMTPSPDIVLHNLKRLAPDVKHLSLAYSRQYSRWYVDLVERQAGKIGIQINAVAVDNIKQAAVFYREYFARAAPHDALWLLQDPHVIDNGQLLAYVMQKAWEHDIVVFSNNPAHVARGALFSHYPANLKLGRQLALLTKQRLSTPDTKKRIIPLQELMLAVNLRTAAHLGYSYPSSLRRKFDLTFPTSR